MRLYSESSEETLRAAQLLKDWAADGILSKALYERLKQETVSDLRSTNIFLRLVLFLFTLIIVGAGVALFLTVFLSHPSEQITGIFFLMFAIACYAAAEAAVSQARLYRYGIEEALAACSVGFLCAGIYAAFFSGSYAPRPHVAELLVPGIGAIFSLWIWRRFGFAYAFLAAMIFVLFLPGYWTSSHAAQHLIVAAFYACGLMSIAVARPRHRFDYLDATYSFAEAFLWLGVYLALNLQLSSLNLLTQWSRSIRAVPEFTRPFYWATWALIWCLPPLILARGFRQKDRFVIAVGMIASILTLVTNKPYLGWQRHTWDPMLLGMLLTGVAFFLRRWLDRGADGIRHGFTARRLSGKDKHWINAGATVVGLVSPHSITPSPESSDVRFGGGKFGGGGASGNF